VFPKAVGLGQEGAENLLPYGAMVFNAFGPRNAHFEAVMAEAAKVVPWINAQSAREALSPVGLGAIIWAAVDTGEITAEEAPLLVRSLLSAGLRSSRETDQEARIGATGVNRWCYGSLTMRGQPSFISDIARALKWHFQGKFFNDFSRTRLHTS
jgi:hypothetical protein